MLGMERRELCWDLLRVPCGTPPPHAWVLGGHHRLCALGARDQPPVCF